VHDVTKPPAEPTRRTSMALGFAAVLVVVLGLLLVSGRHEITRSWGLTGEQGELVVASCATGADPDGDGQRDREQCRGTFTPDDGGAAYDVEALLAADPGDRVRVGADGPDETAYRSDVWGRWSAVGLPLLPLALLWLVPWFRWFMGRPGARARRRDTVLLVLGGLVPAGVVLLAGVGGFLVAVLLG
jgi:hypothetical protein